MDLVEPACLTNLYLQFLNRRKFGKQKKKLLSIWRQADKAKMGNLAKILRERYQLLSFDDGGKNLLPVNGTEKELKSIEAKIFRLTSGLFIVEQRLDAINFVKDLYELFKSCKNVSKDNLDKFPQAYCSLRTLARQVLNPGGEDDEMAPGMRYSLLTCHPNINEMFFAKILAWLSKRKKRMRLFLLRQWNALFAWDHKLESQSLTVTVTEVEKLVNLCNALEAFGLLKFVINKLSGGISDMFLDRFRKVGPCNVRYEALDGAHRLSTFMSPILPSELNEEEMLQRSNAVISFFDVLSDFLDVTVVKGVHLGSAVGNILGDSLMESIVAICLKPYVPPDGGDKSVIEKQVDQYSELESKLRKRKFLNTQFDALHEFLLEYDSITCERECEVLTSTFRALLRSPLEALNEVRNSLTKLTASEVGLTNPSVESKAADLGATLAPYRATISSLVAPWCTVSSWVVDYVEQIESTLCKAFETTSQRRAIRYFEVCRAGAALAIVHGKDHLKEASQSAFIAALCFNNLCYLARCLLELNVDVERKLSALLHYSPSLLGFTFVDVAKKFRSLAAVHLDAFLEYQTTQLERELKSADVFAKVGIGGGLNFRHGRIKNCVKQLLCVHNEWSGLLPGHAMRVSYGRLVDCVFAEIIASVLPLEDITTKEASGLDDALTALMADVEFLFSSEKPPRPEAYCEKWPRMKELLFVLENNLRGIEERWNDGKGPLACSFTADELRMLIRAIFQNTDQRAAVLSKLTVSFE